ncbi:TPA: hypothetical protein NJZ29_004611 [Vibrio parahaemolyticus]|uniref:hypothetical protein n=1 Tax=Vibrio vulnificus TaxID=672 RepID=UPI0012D406E0|nr:hypothetical protein [Vibrio vulnificus]HCG5437686.1 hypothetical protein [Vibrio parahaemolyticus]
MSDLNSLPFMAGSLTRFLPKFTSIISAYMGFSLYVIRAPARGRILAGALFYLYIGKFTM